MCGVFVVTDGDFVPSRGGDGARADGAERPACDCRWRPSDPGSSVSASRSARRSFIRPETVSVGPDVGRKRLGETFIDLLSPRDQTAFDLKQTRCGDLLKITALLTFADAVDDDAVVYSRTCTEPKPKSVRQSYPKTTLPDHWFVIDLIDPL